MYNNVVVSCGYARLSKNIILLYCENYPTMNETHKVLLDKQEDA